MADFVVTVDQHSDFPLDESDIQNLDFIQIGESSYHLIHDNQSFLIDVLSVDLQQKTLTLRISGKTFDIRIADQYDFLVKKMGLSSVVVHKIKEVKAPMPGLVLDILTTPGQTIQQGDALLILEAMKMENIIKSPGDGVIKTIKVDKGQPVEKGVVLIELE